MGSVAVMVVLFVPVGPENNAVARPIVGAVLLIVATAGFDEFHVTDEVRSGVGAPPRKVP